MQDEYEYKCAENVQRLSLLLSINMEFLLKWVEDVLKNC